jgi:hypothetical protein
LKQDPTVQVVNTNNKNIHNFCLHFKAEKRVPSHGCAGYFWQIKHSGSQAEQLVSEL